MDDLMINMLPDLAGFENSINQSFEKLASIKEHQILAEESRQKQLTDLITISTQGIADSDNIEISKALEGFQREAIDVVSKHKGKLPYVELAKLNSKNLDLKMMVAKSAEFRKEYQDLMKALAMDKSEAYDKEESAQNLEALLKTPLAERPSLWNAVTVNSSPLEFVKKNANKDVVESYEVAGNALKIKKTNNPEDQIRNTFWPDKKWKRQVTAQYEDAYGHLPVEQRPYKTALDYAVATYAPAIRKEAEQFKKNPTVRLAGGGSGSKTPKLYTLTGSTYSFNANPIALYGISINNEPNSTQRLFNVTEYDKSSGIAKGYFAAPIFYTWDEVKKDPKLYKDVGGNTEEEKRARYAEMVQNPSALSDDTRAWLYGQYVNPLSETKSQGQTMEIEVTPEVAGLIEGKLANYNNVPVGGGKSASATSGGKKKTGAAGF